MKRKQNFMHANFQSKHKLCYISVPLHSKSKTEDFPPLFPRPPLPNPTVPSPRDVSALGTGAVNINAHLKYLSRSFLNYRTPWKRCTIQLHCDIPF